MRGRINGWGGGCSDGSALEPAGNKRSGRHLYQYGISELQDLFDGATRMRGRHVVVDREPQADIVHGIARLQLPRKRSARWVKGFVSRSHASTSQSPSSRRKPSHSTDRVCIRRRRVSLPSSAEGISLSCFDAEAANTVCAQLNLTIIFPSADRDCMVLNASRKSSNGTTLPTTGCNLPDASQSNNCAIRRA